MLGRRFRAVNERGEVVAVLSLGHTAARVEQQCRATLYYGWPEHAADCKLLLGQVHWGLSEVEQVSAFLKRVSNHPGIGPLAQRAHQGAAHWGYSREQFIGLWSAITEFFAEAEQSRALVDSEEIDIPDETFVSREIAATAVEAERRQQGASNTLFTRLRWARTGTGMSVEQLARESDLTAEHVRKLESGTKQNPTLDTLKRLAGALGVPISFLLGDEPANAAAEIGRRFREWYSAIGQPERELIREETVEQRFARVVTFLLREFPSLFSEVSLAVQLGLSVQHLHAICHETVAVSLSLCSRLAKITDCTHVFLITGEDPSQTQSIPEEMIPYVRVLEQKAFGMPADQPGIQAKDKSSKK